MTHVLERFRLGRYVMLRLDGEHPLFPGKTLEYEHRVVVAEQLGRPLDEKEVVHHERETWNNDPKFLKLKASSGEHLRDHHRRPCSPETRIKIGLANRGRKKTDEERRKIGDANRGKVRSAEFKAKVSATMTGRVFTDEHRVNLSRALKGNGKGKKRGPITEETRIKMSSASKRSMTPERVTVLSERARAAWSDPEIRARQTAAIRAYWANKKAAREIYRADGDTKLGEAR